MPPYSFQMRLSLTLLGLRLRKEYGKRRHHDHPPLVKDPVAHGEGADGPDPDLPCLLTQVSERLSELGIETQPPVKFFQRRKESLTVAALPGNVRQGQQPLPHSLRVRYPIRHGFGRGGAHL